MCYLHLESPTSFNLFLSLNVQHPLPTKQKLFYACPNRKRKPGDGYLSLNTDNVLQDVLITRGLFSAVILKETVLLRGFWTWHPHKIYIPGLKPPQEWPFLSLPKWYPNTWRVEISLFNWVSPSSDFLIWRYFKQGITGQCLNRISKTLSLLSKAQTISKLCQLLSLLKKVLTFFLQKHRLDGNL